MHVAPHHQESYNQSNQPDQLSKSGGLKASLARATPDTDLHFQQESVPQVQPDNIWGATWEKQVW